ncbi:hypothetical protein SAMN05421806_109207 [Streptomyces indicus]|uniref:Uncharacterized protein n=2 Tax=Streptomyces indicus TaxID=417292 RepID=A0A1G9DFU0_9ACTN|nr:hypothetical protein SAMN05421806_109207 [Streptomyces indicus]
MPFPDGWEPDDDRDHGGADEEFASVVFDEDFVRGAPVHEPTAVERLLAAAQARAEAEAHRARGRPAAAEDDGDEFYDGYEGRGRLGHYGDEAAYHHDESHDDGHEPDVCEDRLARRSQARWHRPVAWLLALLMGIGMVALAFSAVYRGASSPGRQDRTPPPATTGVDQTGELGQGPSASADYSPPAVSAEPRTP